MYKSASCSVMQHFRGRGNFPPCCYLQLHFLQFTFAWQYLHNSWLHKFAKPPYPPTPSIHTTKCTDGGGRTKFFFKSNCRRKPCVAIQSKTASHWNRPLCSGQTRIFLSGNSLFHLEYRGLGPPVGHICCAFVALTWCLSAGYKTLPFLRAFEPILKESWASL